MSDWIQWYKENFPPPKMPYVPWDRRNTGTYETVVTENGFARRRKFDGLCPDGHRDFTETGISRFSGGPRLRCICGYAVTLNPDGTIFSAGKIS